MDENAPGLGAAAERLWRMAFPLVRVTEPAAGIRLERDFPVPMRDGVALRANVFRPDVPGRFPVVMSAQPYGKDDFPALKRYRFMRSPEPVTFSAYTSWEAPDPSHWVPRGYAVVNLDLRGFGTSGGVGSLFSDQEAQDYAEAIEWAAAQSWCTGKVGLNGVSYLALSQWKVAALHPPHLAAICPWEGWTDVYRDLAYPGGVREDGFLRFWAPTVERDGRADIRLREGQVAHPDWDDFWAARVPQLERIAVPALICGSFSDQCLHARGAFEGFRRIGSVHRFLYTHRGGKWSTYYSADALALQTRFFDCFLKGEDNGMRDAARVRLEVRERGDQVHSVRAERDWPLPGTRWTRLYLAPGRLAEKPPDATVAVRVQLPSGCATFRFEVPEDFELSGPMMLRLNVELAGTADANLFVAVRKLHGDAHVSFEGTCGFGHDVVAKGWIRTAHRRLDEGRSELYRPFHPCDRPEPLEPGQTASVDIEILSSATLFRRGDVLRVDVQGHWFWRRNPLFGLFPFDYAPSPAGTAILHLGGRDAAFLLVPRTG